MSEAEEFARKAVDDMYPADFPEQHPRSALALLEAKYEVHNAVANECARRRAILVHQLHEAGQSWSELGDWIGVTRARAQQLGRTGGYLARKQVTT